MITILISDTFFDQVPASTLERAVLAVLERHELGTEHDLAVAVDDDERLKLLNQEYLGIDAPTDVLSFSSGGDEVDPDNGHPYLGDVIISYPRAIEQSQAAGHSVIDELQLLVVHGTLHLLGYDHAEPQEKEEMWQLQREILDSLQVKINRLPE